ncbi:MoxR family ATPase [Halalkalibacterium halodurans]|uniref:Methanol dehydrogenase regulatory protein n=1 Tax=Halalkalibacterium halodurans (strain ATCC BAA-125 / DSM 18197 / FERM 7344 / JCM 9153 / C-125) TaxID=272558 RepID=Q9KF81_HALH5|nr:MoxR family ATPase [Halalkalibacterium halodurans]MED4124535.1 MoxR family ATPase [Halalkalibacterium halodurans]MED4173206.1 MoxR family ATPase [Halalkalibacterium halodurans]BAB04323.1 methanol dehydrogenase regulatory protein [Halalkalibacterium halodurans C-125]
MNETMQRIARVIENVERVVVGKRQEIELSLVALFASGHVLLEDVPGVGKTMLVKAIARSLGADFKRIQFTPDLLPSDVTGVSIYNQKTQQFEFRPGPIMANVVLADEINRTSPKTQSALLEALEEGSVTIEGKSLVLSKPFFVMATQNPVEYAGTYPLPEAQLDRFLFRLQLGYPKPDEELDVLKRLEKKHPIQELSPVMETEEVIQLQEEIKDVFVEDNVKAYIVEIVNLTRKHQKVELGVSPRGSIAMMKAAQAYAMIQGRDYVIPDDIKTLAPFALSHRLILTAEAKMSGTDHEEIIHDVLQQAKVPVIRKELLT